MAQYKFVGPTDKHEQIFIATYDKLNAKDTVFITLEEGKVYELTEKQIESLPKLQDGTLNSMFQEVVEETPEEPTTPETPEKPPAEPEIEA